MFKRVGKKASGLKIEKRSHCVHGGQGVLSMEGAWSLHYWAGFMSEKKKAIGIADLAYSSMSLAIL